MSLAALGRKIGWYGWRRDAPDFRDKWLEDTFGFGLAPFREGGVPYAMLPRIINQGQQGSCTGHGMRTIGMTERALSGQKSVELSPRFPYWCGRVLEGTTGQDAGCSIRSVVRGATKFGLADLTTCPYDQNDWRTRPSADAYKEATTDLPIAYYRMPQTMSALSGALSKRHPIIFGFTVYENFESDEVTNTGIMPLPQGDDVGGHCVVAVYKSDSRQAVLCANSWNVDWGCPHPEERDSKKRGYFWMPYRVFFDKNQASDHWVITKIT